MKKLRYLDFTDFYYCAEQKIVSLVTSLFENPFRSVTRRPSRALDSPRTLLPELQRYKDTVMCVALGVEVPGHRKEQLTQTLIVHLSETHLFLLLGKLGGPGPSRMS